MSVLFQIILFISIIVGICLIIFSLITFNNNKSEPGVSDRYLETSNLLKVIDSSIDDVDKALEEMDKTAKSIFDEIDGKYQELLFLYKLLDEKKNEVIGLYSKTPAAPTANTANLRRYENPKLGRLMELKNNGMTTSEIAKEMDMGQGEVKLILELSGEGR